MKSQIPHELISAYFDGEVTPDERATVERLLAANEGARSELNEFSKLSALLHSFPREFAPAELVENVERETSQKELPKLAPAAPVIVFRNWMRDVQVGLASGLSAACLVLAMVAWNPWTGAEPARGVAIHKRSAQSGGTSGPSPLNTARSDQSAPTEIAKTDGGSDREIALPLNEENKLANTDTAHSAAVVQAELSKSEVLKSLQDGKLVELRVVDPAKNVAVVEFTVSDINKAVQRLQNVLVKNDIRPWSGDEQTKAALSEKAAAKNDSEMVIIYTIAPGDQLVKTLFDVKQHPDLFRDWTYQQPVSLEPSSTEIADATGASRKAEKLKQTEAGATDEMESANAEANQAYKTVIDRALNVSAVVPGFRDSVSNDKNAEDRSQSNVAARPKSIGTNSIIGNNGSVVEVSPAVPAASPRNETFGNSLTFRRPTTDVLTNSASNSANQFVNSAPSQNSLENSGSQQRGSQASALNQPATRTDNSNRLKMLWILHPAPDSPPAAAAAAAPVSPDK